MKIRCLAYGFVLLALSCGGAEELMTGGTGFSDADVGDVVTDAADAGVDAGCQETVYVIRKISDAGPYLYYNVLLGAWTYREDEATEFRAFEDLASAVYNLGLQGVEGRSYRVACK